MVEKNAPTILDYHQPPSLRDFLGPELCKALQRAPDTQPSDKGPGQYQNSRDHRQLSSPHRAGQGQHSQQAELYEESHDPAAGGRKKQGANRKNGEQGHEGQLVAPRAAEQQHAEPQRNDQLHQPREVVAIYIGSKGSPPVSQLTNPVKFSVKCIVLDNPKYGQDKTQYE